ncbi:poly(A)-specific ribonuclease PARN-like [Oppia nitens]|uniref:poly(A)-specific ribonuclease PARN-like n=1 Tax=Oppia nitens TaxID=1686743 RepID=UPI0023DA7915|nr:poly(A)-specific ribonuclease PARN-like [Oppia nitens]
MGSLLTLLYSHYKRFADNNNTCDRKHNIINSNHNNNHNNDNNRRSRHNHNNNTNTSAAVTNAIPLSSSVKTTTNWRKTSMDVTRHNFLQVIGQLEAIIADADFLTIDTELTGLRRMDTKALNLLDTIDERYFKLRQSIAGFNLIQFGLTCFKKSVTNTTTNGADTNTGGYQYDCHSYNFYIFPQKSPTINKAMGDRVFSVQTSSLQFLANNGFDFNKLIIDGISYLNDAEAKLCKESFDAAKKQNKTVNSSPMSTSAVTDEDKKFVAEMLSKVQEFIADDTHKTIDLSPCHAFKRRLIYESLKAQEFSDSVEIKTIQVSPTSSDRYISVSKIDKLEKERKESEALTEAIGFTKVIQMIIQYQKPVIGHNVMLDLMHTFNQFIEPLPTDYKTFKAMIHSLFPIIYDTKHISSFGPFKDKIDNTALGDLYERLKTSPFEMTSSLVHLKNGVYSEGKTLHEAGYDSYITGLCFVGLVGYLGSLVDPKIERFDQILLQDYQNKLNMIYSHDYHFYNMGAEELVPDRSHVFYVTFPKEWRTNELFHLFSAFGGVSIGWTSDTSALCALKDPKNVDKIKKSLLKTSANSVYKVITYDEFVRKTSKQSETITSSLVNEDKRKTIKDEAKGRTSPKQSTTTPKTKKHKSNDGKKVTSNSQKLFDESIEWDV